MDRKSERPLNKLRLRSNERLVESPLGVLLNVSKLQLNLPSLPPYRPVSVLVQYPWVKSPAR